MKKYELPKLEMTVFDAVSVITLSSETQTDAVTAWQQSYGGTVKSVYTDQLSDVLEYEF